VPAVEIDNFSMAISLLTSSGGQAVLPASIKGYLPPYLASRPFARGRPTVDLMVGYHKANASPILKRFLSRVDELADRIYGGARR
jgi:LysR family hca operon transcriptional activator